MRCTYFLKVLDEYGDVRRMAVPGRIVKVIDRAVLDALLSEGKFSELNIADLCKDAQPQDVTDDDLPQNNCMCNRVNTTRNF